MNARHRMIGGERGVWTRQSGADALREFAAQLQAEERIVGFVAMAAGDGLRVAARARILAAAVRALVEVAQRAALAAQALAACALLVEQAPQFLQTVACDGGLVGGDGVVAVVVVAARRASHA